MSFKSKLMEINFQSLIRKLGKAFILILIIFLIYTPLSYLTGIIDQTERANCLRENNESFCFKNFLKYKAYGVVRKCYISQYDEKGISEETVIVWVDVYALNLDDFSNNKIEALFSEINSIWKDYGIQFQIKNLNRINDNSLKPIAFPNDEALIFAENVAGENLYRTQDTVIDVIFAKELPAYLKIIKWKIKFAKVGGRGLRMNDTNLILFSTDTKNLSWTLAHEIAHIMGHEDKAYFSGEYNFMTHQGCIKDKYYPTILNQEQVDRVIEFASSFEHKSI